jgi:hypothetical protein
MSNPQSLIGNQGKYFSGVSAMDDRSRTIPLALFFFVFMLGASTDLHAQLSSITGTIRDQSGAVVPRALITITNLGTNAERTAVANDNGEYSLPLLPAGIYSVQAALPGFKTNVVENVEVHVNTTLRINVTLTVGAVSEQVLVTEPAPLVRSETSSVGHLVDHQKLLELPLNGRQFESLVQLVPGTASPAPGSALATRGGFNAGARETSNSVVLDGIDNNDPAINNFTLRPIVDSIQEFKVITNSAAAEFGRSAGAQLVVGTKVGTNELHISAWEFLRNDKLDARDFFNTRGPKPPLRRNQFGATAGGAIVPDKAFFFGAYEGLRRRQQFTSLQQVPSASFRTGDFSASGRTITDPFTMTPFAGNRIPVDMIHPISKRILDRGSFPPPAPDLPEPNNFLAVNSFPQDLDQFNARVDHRLSASNTLLGRYSFARDKQAVPCPGNLQTSCIPGYGHVDTMRAHALSLADTHIFSWSTALDVRFGFNRQLQPRVALRSNSDDVSTEIGIPASDDPRNFGHPNIIITGVGMIGDRPYQNRAGTTVESAANFSYTTGAHILKAGIDVRRMMFYAGTNGREVLRFDGRWTGNAFADFLVGLPGQTSRDLSDSFRYHVLSSYNFFVQNDFRLSNRLTFNLGMRYEYNTPDVEKQDRMAQINVVTGQYEIANRNGASRALYNPDRNNFAPRAGFALRTSSGRAAFRGAYGMFYDQAIMGNQLSFVRNGPPFQMAQQFNASANPRDLTLSVPFPAARLNQNPIFDSPSIHPDFRDAYIQQWNAGYEREIGSSMLYEIGYAGSKGTRLSKAVDVNQAYPGPGPVQSRRPMPQYGAVTLLESSGNSTYHALLSRMERRFSDRFSFLASYTWAHSIDDAAPGNVTQDARNQKAERGSSDFDVRHRLVFSYIYALPFSFQISGITTFQSGRPVFVQLSPATQNSQTGSTRDRPNVTGVAPVFEHHTNKTVYLNPAAFVIPPAGQFGNAPRNYFNGPGTHNWDIALARNFVTEAVNVQFRAELFNAFNRTSLNQPNRFPDSPAFGTITSTFRENRQIQFGLKIT